MTRNGEPQTRTVQMFDPLAEEAGRFTARWVKPEDRMDALEDVYRLMRLAREYPYHEAREPLREALETITVERDGRRMYRTRSGIPMEMPAKFERIVRAALADKEEEPR